MTSDHPYYGLVMVATTMFAGHRREGDDVEGCRAAARLQPVLRLPGTTQQELFW